ncbi:universal stress protein [Salinarchaeum sp. IM2453]|uniref:universal stress protein n=1 Tax=Salinarchaeum sp. IM2453 TaxID=2862870 RepID=UPI001C83B5C1|nr:universal stress protein [Salinarchaeum sp. IM2453]QZA88281.1 universal stress protein [Salinarchaeum sp. IM2453]
MYQVLLGVDTDETRARTQANMVADMPAANEDIEVFVVHVFQENPEGASIGQVGSVRTVTESFDEHDISYELVEASGDPADKILEIASERDVDMICVSGRDRTPTGKVLFGSTTQSVILGTNKPVVTVGPETA